MGSLYTAYYKYYQNPSYTNTNTLWYNILEYTHEEKLDKIALLRQAIPPKPQLIDFQFHSNGSMGDSRAFGFGPHTKYWLNAIEDLTKYRPTTKFVNILNSVTNIDPRLICCTLPAERTRNDTIPAAYYISLQFTNPDAVPFLITELQKIGNCGISTTPNNWLYLLADPDFRQFLEHSQVAAMSTGWELFCQTPPQNVHFNDNMVNWTTGMNFYTCEAGTKHFLPIFVPTNRGIVNLINISQPAMWPTDDLMTIGQHVYKCACGKNYQHFTFIPHIEAAIRNQAGQIIYDPGLANELKGRYINLQFIQRDQTIDILFILISGPLDRELLRDYFGACGLRTNFVKDKYLRLGAKLPVFRRVNSPITYTAWTAR